MRELALFAGSGGGILGGHLLGWKTICAVESDPYSRSVLLARQLDGILPPFPIWDEIETFKGESWRGIVDVVSGGFPCQDISSAGKGEGLAGKRSGLWYEMARIIGEVHSRYVWIENTPLLYRRGLHIVLTHLTEMGYDTRWGIVGAYHASAPHKRDRIWVFGERNIPDANGQRETRSEPEDQRPTNTRRSWRTNWWESESGVLRVADGVAHRMDRLKAVGNGQVPAVVRLAWEILAEDKEV